MLFLAVLVAATVGSWVVMRGDGHQRAAARWGLAIATAAAGLSHLVNPTPFEQHLPDWVPAEGVLVLATGVIEIALGVALAVIVRRRQAVGVITALYLAAVFPANVYVAVTDVDVDGQPGGAYPWIRLPLQVLFIVWALWSTTEQPSRPDAEPRVAVAPLPVDVSNTRN